MAKRFYIVPIISTGETYPKVATRAAYIQDVGGQVLRSVSYGLEPIALVLAEVTPTQHTTIMQNADVIAAPLDVSANITAQALPTVQAALESINIPADWVTTAFTYRAILKIVGGLFLFTQRYYGMFALRLWRGGVTLSTQFNQLPAAERQRLIDCADSFGYDRSTLSGTSTLRQILRAMAVQWVGNVMDADEVQL